MDVCSTAVSKVHMFAIADKKFKTCLERHPACGERLRQIRYLDTFKHQFTKRAEELEAMARQMHAQAHKARNEIQEVAKALVGDGAIEILSMS